ncbi:MAG: ferredoxin [Elusimicrobia bacterium CG08_land_8_20_14_0_20_59_10]|nr:MAG: ferredoxin [Elusimicrobia bacterium CG08_land_8_20_14_0_20_59_10]
MAAVIDASTCASCGACVDACPAGAITLKTIAVVSAAKCTGCGACIDVCGPAAIVLKKR